MAARLDAYKRIGFKSADPANEGEGMSRREKGEGIVRSGSGSGDGGGSGGSDRECRGSVLGFWVRPPAPRSRPPPQPSVSSFSSSSSTPRGSERLCARRTNVEQ